MAYTHNSQFLSQCIVQILREMWTPPSKQQMERNSGEVVTKYVGLPGRLKLDPEAEGFTCLRWKDER